MKRNQIDNFADFFDSIPEDVLVEMVLYAPQQLKTMCIFLALDEQIRLEAKEAALKEIRKKLKKVEKKKK
jgi:hypothetical protein